MTLEEFNNKKSILEFYLGVLPQVFHFQWDYKPLLTADGYQVGDEFLVINDVMINCTADSYEAILLEVIQYIMVKHPRYANLLTDKQKAALTRCWLKEVKE